MDLQIAPIQALMWEERERMGTIPAPWGTYYLLTGKGGWTVLEEGPTVKVVELGKGLRDAV